MRINNACLLPIITPFALVALARAVWWFAGASWDYPEAAAFVAILAGVPIGIWGAAVIVVAELDVGHFTIGKSEE